MNFFPENIINDRIILATANRRKILMYTTHTKMVAKEVKKKISSNQFQSSPFETCEVIHTELLK